MTWLWHTLPPHLQFWLTFLWIVYLVVLAGWIALQKREPIATLSWLLSLALLPVVGLLIYHFLGPQRIRRQRLKRLRSRARLDTAASDELCADCSPLMRLAQACSSYAPSSASRVQLLVDGQLIAEDTFAKDGGHQLAAPFHAAGPTATVTVIVDKTHAVPGDLRKLGVVITGLGFR